MLHAGDVLASLYPMANANTFYLNIYNLGVPFFLSIILANGCPMAHAVWHTLSKPVPEFFFSVTFCQKPQDLFHPSCHHHSPPPVPLPPHLPMTQVL